jgi:hypothetical protein
VRPNTGASVGWDDAGEIGQGEFSLSVLKSVIGERAQGILNRCPLFQNDLRMGMDKQAFGENLDLPPPCFPSVFLTVGWRIWVILTS